MAVIVYSALASKNQPQMYRRKESDFLCFSHIDVEPRSHLVSALHTHAHNELLVFIEQFRIGIDQWLILIYTHI